VGNTVGVRVPSRALMTIGRLPWLVVALATGCGGPGAPKPQLQLDVQTDMLVLTGSGFTDKLHCAQLSVIGFPQPALIDLGKPNCTQGAFTYQWPLKRTGCKDPKTKLHIVVLAVGDLNKVDAASASGDVIWDDSCGLSGYCGAIGQDACPDGCTSDDAAVSFGKCVACGEKGEVPCARCKGKVDCQDGCNHLLVPDLGVCTDRCGHAQGTSCKPPVPFCSGHPPVLTQPQPPCRRIKNKRDGSTIDIFRCYDGSRLPDPSTGGECLCLPPTTSVPPGNCNYDESEPDPAKPYAGECIHIELGVSKVCSR
jgi:hypothetical protein